MAFWIVFALVAVVLVALCVRALRHTRGRHATHQEEEHFYHDLPHDLRTYVPDDDDDDDGGRKLRN